MATDLAPGQKAAPIPLNTLFSAPATKLASDAIASWNRPDVSYTQIATIDWKEMPELFWRTFQPVTNYDRSTDAIYVFRWKLHNFGFALLP